MALRFLRYTFAVMLCAVLTAGALNAASFTYSDQAKRIKAGVLLTAGSSMNPDDRPNPYMFYVMDQRQDIKPAGWEFYNPMASSHVTDSIANRWNGKLNIGEPINKNMGCYWEVYIGEVTPDELAQYDVLFLSGYSVVSFSDGRQREKLRKFVDNGGVLWIDYQQKPGAPGLKTVLDPLFFVPGMAFSSGGVGAAVRANITDIARAHALLNRLFLISGVDVNLLGGFGGAPIGDEYLDMAAGGEASRIFVPVAERGGKQVVSAAQYGSGYIVVTADGVAQAIGNPVGSGYIDPATRQFVGSQPDETDPVCGTFFIAAQLEDLKLAYNIVNWGSESPTYRKNPRHTGYSFEEIGSPLVPLWTFTMQTPGAGRVDGSPVILDDMVFYVDSNYVLHAFDLSPIRDRDGNGNPDDGIVDYANGAPYDELWKVNIGEPCSPPTVAYAPINGAGAVPSVFIVTQSGKVKAYNALDFAGPTAVNLFTAATEVLNGFSASNAIPAATYAEGSLYVGDGWGVMHVHDFFTGTEWAHPKQPQLQGMVSNSPTVGYFHDPTSGATELIAYQSGRGAPSASIQGFMKSYPIRSFNEMLTKEGSSGLYRVRSVNTCIATTSPFAPQLYYNDPVNGQVWIPATDFNVVPIPTTGKFLITNVATVAEINRLEASVVADYRLDYTNPAAAQPYRAVSIWHDASSPTTDFAGITGPPAAGKNDTLYFCTENGSIYAIKEAGRSGITAGGATSTPLVFKWRWCFQDPAVKARFGINNVEIVGSPVVVNDMAYVGVNIGGEGYLFAFYADPAFTIRLKYPIAPNTQVLLKQWDALHNPTFTDPPGPFPFVAASDTDVDKAVGDTVALVDYDTSKISVINFRARAGAGELTSSADVMVQYVPLSAAQSGQSTLETHFAFAPNTGDKWNNLAWFMKLANPGNPLAVPPILPRTPYKISSAPTVMGDVLYLGCADGSIIAVDVGKASKATSSLPKLLGNVEQKEFADPMTGLDRDYVWAKQLAPVGSPIWAPPTGSHGMLAVATPSGLSIMYNPTSLVADGNRLVEVDAQGKPIWSCDSTTGFASTFAVGTGGAPDRTVVGSITMPFNRPSVARRAPVGGIVIADTGNNRIVHMDKGGTAIWQIKDFGEVDSNAPLLPPGSSMELNKPTDVTCWQTTENVQIGGNWVALPIYHYLIADNGNNRVIEIVCRYDTVLGQYRNMVTRVSANLAEGEPRRFITARIATYDANGPATVMCAMANDSGGSPGVNGLGGSLVEMNWKTPVLPTDLTGNLVRVTNRLPIDAVAPAGYKLVNPTFFNRQYVSGTEYADVVIDAAGVHVCNVVSGVASVRSYLFTDHWDTDETPLMTKLQVQVLGMPGGTTAPHARPFAPSYAQYLPNGNVLVTNKATGIAYDKDGNQHAFTGEVFEVEIDPADTTKFRRVPGSSIWYLAGFHQPLSAERALY